MSDYNKETAFLRNILCHDKSFKSRHVGESITRVQRDQACMRKAAFTAAALAVLAYIFSHAEFFQSEPRIRLWALTVAGLAAAICSVAFLFVLLVYRVILDRLRDQCRDIVSKLVENRSLLRENALSPNLNQPSDAQTSRLGAFPSTPVPIASNGDSARP
jgi:hypothetical protein